MTSREKSIEGAKAVLGGTLGEGELVAKDIPDAGRPQQMMAPASSQGISSVMDISPEVFKDALERRTQNRESMMQWIHRALVKGVDYGQIHVVGKKNCPHGNNCPNPSHWSKPVLYKPGAEKICGMLGLVSRWPNLPAYEERIIAGEPLDQILFRCELVDMNGNIVSTGIGGRSVKQEYGDINKAFKMCKKSSMIDAVLNAAGLSEVFTQDLEDMAPIDEVDDAPSISEDQYNALHAIAHESFDVDDPNVDKKTEATLRRLARSMGVGDDIRKLKQIKFDDAKSTLEGAIADFKKTRGG